MTTLVGRTALVTGAGRGVGQGIAEVLAEDGAHVFVNDLHADRGAATVDLIRGNGGRADVLAFDVTDAEAVDAAVTAVEGSGTPVDVLVNNAGIAEGVPNGGVRFAESGPETWEPAVTLNVFGSMTVIRRALQGMVERRWGRIVQISSGASSIGLPIGVSAYGAAKAASESLIRHVAVENGPYGVTANALALGLMANVEGMSMEGADIDELFQHLVASIPARRLGTSREVGAAVAFLASDNAGYITGQVIHVNGGTVFGR